MILVEEWNGNKSSVSLLRTFGCVTWAHINDNYRKKLDAKRHACIMMGCSDESKDYRLFDPIKQQIIVSKSVMFDEHILGNK